MKNNKTKKVNPLLLDEQLCFKLYSASRLMTQAYDPLLKELDLTYPQYLVMLVLWESHSVSVKEIGERLLLDSGTLSPLIKKLQDKGFITKTRQKEDERIVMINLTDDGKTLQRSAGKVPLGMACKINFSENDFVELKSRLAKLMESLEESLK